MQNRVVVKTKDMSIKSLRADGNELRLTTPVLNAVVAVEDPHGPFEGDVAFRGVARHRVDGGEVLEGLRDLGAADARLTA